MGQRAIVDVTKMFHPLKEARVSDQMTSSGYLALHHTAVCSMELVNLLPTTGAPATASAEKEAETETV